MLIDLDQRGGHLLRTARVQGTFPAVNVTSAFGLAARCSTPSTRMRNRPTSAGPIHAVLLAGS